MLTLADSFLLPCYCKWVLAVLYNCFACHDSLRSCINGVIILSIPSEAFPLMFCTRTDSVATRHKSDWCLKTPRINCIFSKEFTFVMQQSNHTLALFLPTSQDLTTYWCLIWDPTLSSFIETLSWQCQFFDIFMITYACLRSSSPPRANIVSAIWQTIVDSIYLFKSLESELLPHTPSKWYCSRSEIIEL